MFLAHPFVGVGLKCFPTVLPTYAPPGLPDAVEMGPNHVLTQIEGPHSTYLALLSQTGLLGAISVVGWEFEATVRLYREYRVTVGAATRGRLQVLTLIAGVVVVAIYNCFSEMNATGALPLICVLALAYRMQEPRAR
jgi:O-antigen ligase